jgi:hypothetical protein
MEFIRIPSRLIPPRVVDFYELTEFSRNDAIYFSVHKTHLATLAEYYVHSTLVPAIVPFFFLRQVNAFG